MAYQSEEELQQFVEKYVTPKSDIPVNFNIENKDVPFFNDDITYQPKQYQIKTAPSFTETVTGAFKSYNEFNTLYQYEQDKTFKNPFHDPVPDNYSPSDDPSNFDGLEQKYHKHILKGQSPLDTKNRYFQALSRQEEENQYKDGSLIGQLIGGFGGALTSPSTYIPIARGMKYAKLSQNVLYNIARTAPSIGGTALAHNAWQNTRKMGGNLEDFIVDSIVDTLGGVAFIGAGFGLSHALNGGKLFESNRVLKHIYNGVEIKPVIAKDDIVTGYKASPIVGMNASAAQVDSAQKFADSQFASKGLFGIPYMSKWIGKGASLINPTMRMLNSRFKTAAGAIDRVADHGMLTEGVLEGNARPITFEEKMAKLQGENKEIFDQLIGLHLERNGINSENRALGLLESTKAKWAKDGYIDEEPFSREIIDAMINDEPSKHAAVNEAVALLKPAKDDIFKEWQRVNNFPVQILSPKTADAHLNRVWDVDSINLFPKEWEDMWVEHYSETDKTINSYLQPIKDFEGKVKLQDKAHQEFIRQPGITDEQIKTSAENLKQQKKLLKKMEDNLQNELRSNEDLRADVENAHALSAKEANQLKTILKPSRKLKKELKKQKEGVAKLSHESFIAESQMKEAKTKETVDKYKVELDRLKVELENEKIKRNALQDKYDTELESLQEKAANGQIDPILFNRIKNSQRVKFKNPNDRLKFRKTWESEFHMRQAAKGYADTIANQTAEDTIAQVMGQLIGHSPENPTLTRTLMIPDKKAYKAGFLSTNVAVNIINYRNTLARRTYIKQAFEDVTIDSGFEPVIARLTQEFQSQKRDIIKSKLDVEGKVIPKTQKEIDIEKKELVKLNKDFKQIKLDLNRTYDKMMGRTRGSEGMRKFSSITRSFAAATKLGAVPLTMVADMMGIAFKHGFWPMIRDGLLPMLKTIDGRLKTPEGIAYRENAAHAALGWQHVLSGWSDRNWSTIAQPYLPVSGKIENGMSKIAHLSGNLYGTNYIENVLQRWTASVIQSKIMRFMIQHKEGILKPRDKEKLLIYGLDPDKWADKFIKGWESRGKDGNGFGGLQSRYWEWSDVEASNMMSQVINKGTRDTIIRRGMFDAPFMLDDPIMAMIFPFKGFLFANMTRYLIPLMQRPDGEKLLGTLLMLSAGALVSPLRHITRGESPIADDEKWYMNALRDSNILSIIMEPLDDVNLLTGGRIFPGMQNDKYRNRTKAGAAGPVVGGAYEIGQLLGMAGTGNFNQTDMRKTVGLIPGTQAWYLRYLSNTMIEATGLPKTFAQAQSRG